MEILKKFFIASLLLGWSTLIFGQEKTILKIINSELKKEVKNQLKSPNFSGDTIQIVEPFTINEQQILSFTIKKTSPYFNGVQLVKQEVPLKSILKVGKDINVIFETINDAVKTTTTSIDKETKVQTSTGFLFFLYLSNEKQNEELGIKLQDAFKKAGFNVAKDYWYD